MDRHNFTERKIIQDQDRPKEINKYCILIKRYIKIQRYIKIYKDIQRYIKIYKDTKIYYKDIL